MKGGGAYRGKAHSAEARTAHQRTRKRVALVRMTEKERVLQAIERITAAKL
jgi:hypothetical protein